MSLVNAYASTGSVPAAVPNAIEYYGSETEMTATITEVDPNDERDPDYVDDSACE